MVGVSSSSSETTDDGMSASTAPRRGRPKKIPVTDPKKHSKKPISSAFVFVQSDGRLSKSDQRGMRSHAMTVVRQRQRKVEEPPQQAEPQGSSEQTLQRWSPQPQSPRLSHRGPTENLNSAVCLASLMDLSKSYWWMAESHLRQVLPPIWEGASLRIVTRAPTAFATYHTEALVRRNAICTKDALHGFTHLALSTSWATYVSKSITDPRIVTLFTEQALHALRERLSRTSGAIDSDVALTIGCLCRVENWRGDLDAALAHMQMLRHLVLDMDGFRTFDPLLIDLLLLVDKHLAIERFAAPHLPLTFDPGPIVWPSLAQGSTQHSPAIEHAFATLGTALLTPQVTLILGAGLTAILTDLRNCILVALDVRALSRAGGKPNAHYARWFFLRTTALTYRLLRCEFTLDDAAKPVQRARECVRTATLLWIAFVALDGNTGQSHDSLLPRLDKTLGVCVPESAVDEQNSAGGDLSPQILLWAASIGVIAAGSSSSSASTLSFVPHIIELAERLRIKSREVLREMLESCFFLGDVQGALLDRLESLVIAHGRRDRVTFACETES